MNTAFFNTIKTQLLAIVYDGSNIPYVDMWNNQLNAMLSGGTYSSALPALFIEFQDLGTEQLGNGNQVYPELTVRIHIYHQQVDAGDGTIELDLTVLDLRDAVQTALQNFRPVGSSEFIRQKQEMDYSHDNVYHTSWIMVALLLIQLPASQ